MDIFTLVTSEASLRVLARTRCREWRYCISWSTESFLGLQLVKDWGAGEGHHFYLENKTLVTKGLPGTCLQHITEPAWLPRPVGRIPTYPACGPDTAPGPSQPCCPSPTALFSLTSIAHFSPACFPSQGSYLPSTYNGLGPIQRKNTNE